MRYCIIATFYCISTSKLTLRLSTFKNCLFFHFFLRLPQGWNHILLPHGRKGAWSTFGTPASMWSFWTPPRLWAEPREICWVGIKRLPCSPSLGTRYFVCHMTCHKTCHMTCAIYFYWHVHELWPISFPVTSPVAKADWSDLSRVTTDTKSAVHNYAYNSKEVAVQFPNYYESVHLVWCLFAYQ